MKRKGNIYPEICHRETIRCAIINASKGKRSRRDVKEVLESLDESVEHVRDLLINETFTPANYQRGKVNEGTHRKERIIFKPNFFPDQVVHWCIYLTIRPLLYGSLDAHVCGSIPERGVHYGKKFVERWIQRDRKNTKYFLKIDVRKFYPSVDTQILMTKLRRKIKDEKLLQLIQKILDKETGLPIGVLLSQMFANFFLSDIDHYIKETLRAAYYIRYMDDMVIFGANKKKLRKDLDSISEKLAEIGLHLKGNWQIFKTDKEMLDFMGFRFARDRTILRRSIMYRITRKIKKVDNKGRRATFKDACAVVSYIGWIKHSDSHNLFCARIKPHLHIQRMKNIIRRNAENDDKNKSKHVATV